MGMKQTIIVVFLLSMLFSSGGCGVPQYLWPQDDMEFREINRNVRDKKILIASRQSEFKNALANKIVDAFNGKAVYIKIVGIEKLAGENAEAYSAVVLINTCMAWAVDRKVESYLEKYGKLNSVIVLTTADGGDIFPEFEGLRIDAMSSASTNENIDPVATDIIDKIQKLLGSDSHTPE